MELAYAMKTKDYFENQAEELKWKCQKMEETIDSLNNKIRDLDGKILKLNEENLCEEEKVKTLRETNRELENSLEQHKR